MLAKLPEPNGSGGPPPLQHEVPMYTSATQPVGLRFLGLLAALLILAPSHARAGGGTTDCHEIPAFVLERTEIATRVD
jgi:hypothetical protein